MKRNSDRRQDKDAIIGMAGEIVRADSSLGETGQMMDGALLEEVCGFVLSTGRFGREQFC